MLMLLGAATAALVAGTAAAAPAAPDRAQMEHVRHFSNQTKVPGFYKGRTIRYLDFGPLKLAPGNKVAPIWAFTNGAKAQRNVIDVVPGDRGYTPLWRVIMVTWKQSVKPRVLKSAASVRRVIAAGQATQKRTAIVVNCPVLGFGQKQTIGFAKGQQIAYLDLGPVKLKSGNKVAPIWAFTNGADDQKNVVDVVPGNRGYTPLWRVTMVTWKASSTPRVLRSAAQIRAAVAAGEVTLKRTPTVVNCPVV
jgi:hypothetical protein